MLTLDFFWQDLLENPLTMLSVLLGGVPVLLGAIYFVFQPKLFMLIVKNLRRSPLRTILTSAAIMVLVFMVTLIWAVVFFLDQTTKEKAKDVKLLITERWQLPSQMPRTHADCFDPAKQGSYILNPGDVTANDFMTWSFYGGTLDPTKRTRENIIFFFVMNPDHIRTMMDDLENYDPELIRKLKEKRNGCLIGKERMDMIKQEVGKKFTVTSMNYKGIDLEFEIVGLLPDGRYNQSAIMRQDYFEAALDSYKGPGGKAHEMAAKSMNLIWLRVRDKDIADRVTKEADKITNPQVKCEMASSAIGAFLDAYRDLLNGMKYLLVPAILACMTLVIANAISISVRERYQEIAVLKVLGYRPGQVLTLVLGESLLVGGASGLLAAVVTFCGINYGLGGIKFPIAFFPAFLIPLQALWWGLAMGFTTAYLGSFLPAMTARSVRVSEVFARVA